MLHQPIEGPRLLVFFGMIAAGKSFLARRWSARCPCPWYNTDMVRKELAGITLQSRQPVGLDQGIYSSDFTRKTYDALAKRARADLSSGAEEMVVLDGSYGDVYERQRLLTAFADVCPVYFIYCFCSEIVIKARLSKRARDPQAVSDGNWHIYEKQKERFAIPEKIAGAQFMRLDTDDSLEKLFQLVDRFVGR